VPSDTQVGDPSPGDADSADLGHTRTHSVHRGAWAGGGAHRHFKLTVIAGPCAGLVRESSGDLLSLGSQSLNGMVIDDPTVSRFHCEIRSDAESARVVDLGSSNGTILDGVRVCEAFLRPGAVLQLGETQVRFDQGDGEDALPLSSSRRFGGLVGSSRLMRGIYGVLERLAASDVSVLIEGETGTGKGQAAEAVHRASARASGPFLVVDCSAIPANLMESELFGHEKGSFTGADARRVGAFEEASGGTLFLDEIGELPLDLQPKLLRALENREIRRVGANRFHAVDLRVIAATNRDLRAEVNREEFRSDLYFRLAVVKVAIPPLRQRPEDLPEIVDELLSRMAVAPEDAAALCTPAFMATLRRNSWPGNVRELRNHLEAKLVLAPSPPPPRAGDQTALVPFAEARDRVMASFEHQYLQDLMKRFPGKVAQAAQAARMDRVFLYRLLKRQGIKI
jgi:two-component system, NtrC family, response regulator GlrR